MEVLGGNGYIEEGPLARRFRELPLNSIWEGSGNIMCLDVLRALSREPRSRDALDVVLSSAKGLDVSYDRFIGKLHTELAKTSELEGRARRVTEMIALGVQAAILLTRGPESSARAFLMSRLSEGAPAAFGTLPGGIDQTALIDRVFRVL
jgi:putative acyl-CoA dehydrogenase